ncbi:MAG: SusC/RagA family TonB-linked outer membrane protein [Bacteroidales bacterium]
MKNFSNLKCRLKDCISSQTLLKMKLTFFLLLVAFLQVNAKSYSQMISLSQQNAKLEDVFVEIMKQTNSKFVYSPTMLKETNPVNVNLTNVTLEEALELCFEGQPITYVIDDDNTVIIKMKELPPPPVNGKVLDEKGNPLPFVNIRIKGTPNGVVCDIDGNFTINANIGDVLIISYLGYESQEITLKNLNSLLVSLKVSISNLNEIVVMGYSTRKTSELTGSVQIVSGKELSRSITTPDAISALKGRVTGVDIVNSNPYTAVKATMTMRGQGSFSGGVDPINGAFNDAFYVQTGPLIVIDGAITQFTSIAQAVSIADIESITLLRDAASTAIYGSRAATGVLLVTTKKGIQGKPRLNVTLTSGINYPNFGNVDFMNTGQWLQKTRDAAAISWEQIPSFKTQFPNGYMDLWKNKMGGMIALFDTTFTFDWQKNIITPGILKNATVNLSGGSASSNYYVGFSSYNENGNDFVSKYSQNSLRVKLEHKFNNYISAGMNVSGMFENQKNPATSAEAIMPNLPFYNPYLNSKTSDSVILSTWRGLGTTAAAGLNRRVANPFYDIKYNNAMVKNSNLMGSFWGKVKFTPWLSFTSTNTWSQFRNEFNSIMDRRTVNGGFGQAQNLKGRLDVTSTMNYVFITSNQLNFSRTFFKNHNVGLLAGQEYQYKHLLTTSATKFDVMEGERNLGAGATDTYSTSHIMPTGTEREYIVYSLFGQANYDYSGKYLVSASIRRDASASYSRDGRYKNFWSVSGGWAVSSEKFWEPIRNVVSFLKIRGSYGLSGKDAGADFLNQTLYSRTNKSDYLEKGTFGYYINQLGNDKLTWETTYTTEGGIDLELFKGRVSANFSTYNKAGKDLLMRAQYSSISGIPAQYQNIGDLTNKGWELTLKTINVRRDDFSWTTALTMYHNSNRIDKIRNPASTDDVPVLATNSTYWAYGYSGNFKVGESLNDIKMVKFLRFEQATGYPVFEHVSDTDGSKSEVTITPTSSFSDLLGNPASLQKIGTAVPKVQGGFINEFRYKNFGLGITITYGFGSTVLSRAANATIGSPYSTSWASYNQVALNSNQVYWKPGSPDNHKANVAGPGLQYAYIDGQQSSMYWIKGDAIKIANLRLSYDLPEKLLGKLKISSFQIILSADNLKYFTNKNYLGSDPESVTYQGSGNDTGGSGRLNYGYGYAASPKRVNLTFNIGF